MTDRIDTDVARDEGWAIAIISNVDAPEAGWPHQTEEWRAAARSWLDSVHAADPAPVGLTEDERRWFRECQQDYEGLPAHEDLARALAIIDRLSAAPRAEPCSGDYGCFVVEHIEGCYAIDESPFGRACRIAALTAKLRRLSGSEEQP